MATIRKPRTRICEVCELPHALSQYSYSKDDKVCRMCKVWDKIALEQATEHLLSGPRVASSPSLPPSTLHE
jgi:hypothetical protein